MIDWLTLIMLDWTNYMFLGFFAVKHLKIEKNTSQNASNFEFVGEKGEDAIFMCLLHVCICAFLFKCQRIDIVMNYISCRTWTYRWTYSDQCCSSKLKQVFSCKMFECIELKISLLFFSPLFSAKWIQCNPPSFYHHLRIWSLCLSAQS